MGSPLTHKLNRSFCPRNSSENIQSAAWFEAESLGYLKHCDWSVGNNKRSDWAPLVRCRLPKVACHATDLHFFTMATCPKRVRYTAEDVLEERN